MVVVALLSVYLVESVYVVSVYLVVNCTKTRWQMLVVGRYWGVDLTKQG